MPKFPSIEWFDQVKRVINADPMFRSLGSCDTTVGIVVSELVYAIKFEGFLCESIKKIDTDGLRDTDFYLEMSTKNWKSFIENIKNNHGADSSHTLNSLDITLPDGLAKSHDQLNKTRFLRYHLSLQAYFDASSKIDTVYK